MEPAWEKVQEGKFSLMFRETEISADIPKGHTCDETCMGENQRGKFFPGLQKGYPQDGASMGEG